MLQCPDLRLSNPRKALVANPAGRSSQKAQTARLVRGARVVPETFGKPPPPSEFDIDSPLIAGTYSYSLRGKGLPPVWGLGYLDYHEIS
jgi:hypothetical protein